MTRFLKDIFYQPMQLLRSLEFSLGYGKKEMDKAASLIRDSGKVYISAIGASWNAGLAIQAVFQEMNILAILCDASEFLYFAKIPPGSVVLFLSRSGRSIEIVNALPKCKLANAAILSITNAEDSILAGQSDVCLLTHVDFDHSISASTYLSIILTGQLLALRAGKSIWRKEFPDSLANVLQEIQGRLISWQEIIESGDWTANRESSYFLGRGANLASAHEGMLLWEEAAKQPAAALSTGAFRHGPQEIVRPGLSLTIWLENALARNHDIALIHDLYDKGVDVVTIGSQLTDEVKGKKIEIPSLPGLLGADLFTPVINIIPVQMMAEKLARTKGEDPDHFTFCNFVVEREGGL